MKEDGRAKTGSTGDELLDTRQAAEFLMLKTATLENWRWRGVGPPHVRLSRRAVRYRRRDLEAWLTEQTRTSTSDTGGDRR